MTARALYTQSVLEHSRAPRNFGRLEGHTHAADGANPLCGDALRCEIRSVDGRVDALRFSGAACAIATATASMLSGIAGGLSAEQIAMLEQRFQRLIEGSVESDGELGELNAMQALVRHPARRKCALLPFATLRAALAGAASATTEG
jgi:nitrogen fixation NifU-like protein